MSGLGGGGRGNEPQSFGMEPNMDAQDRSKYGLKLIAGGAAPTRICRRRSPIGTRAQLDLDQRMRHAFQLHAVTPSGQVVSRSVLDVLDGRQKPWASLGRRAEEMHDAGSEGFRRIVDELIAWHDANFGRRPAA